MTVTTQMVKDLRQATGAGILDAKKALEEMGGDFQKAVDLLREKGLAKAAKKIGREAKEGLVELYAHPGNRVGVLLEINCETDFVARNEMFQQLAHDLALQIAAMSPRYISAENVSEADLTHEREVMRAQTIAEGKPLAVVDKIVAARLQKYYEETCLLEQPFVKDETRKIKDLLNATISQLGENIIVRRFVRYELGEAL